MLSYNIPNKIVMNVFIQRESFPMGLPFVEHGCGGCDRILLCDSASLGETVACKP